MDLRFTHMCGQFSHIIIRSFEPLSCAHTRSHARTHKLLGDDALDDRGLCLTLQATRIIIRDRDQVQSDQRERIVSSWCESCVEVFRHACVPAVSAALASAVQRVSAKRRTQGESDSNDRMMLCENCPHMCVKRKSIKIQKSPRRDVHAQQTRHDVRTRSSNTVRGAPCGDIGGSTRMPAKYLIG